MEQRSTSTFGLYESLRIIVPGFYFATLFLFLYWCFLSQYLGYVMDGFPLFIMFVSLLLVSGLTMYAKEAAKRRKAFVENQPSTFLKERSKLLKNSELLDDASARKLYFYILNHHVPQSFHDKIFFFGTIYHIMILIRRTSFWFAIAATAGLCILIANGQTLATQSSAVVFTVAVWLIYVLNARYNKADRKMQENYQDQIFWLEMNQELVESSIRQFTRSRAAISK